MFNVHTFLVASTTVAFQLAESAPIRLGSVARNLSPSDVSEIVQLARERGRTPWLVIGFPSMIRNEVRLTVYLEPDDHTGQVRRGTRLLLVATESRSSERSDWSVKSTSAYAHVVLPGRAPGDLRDDFDAGRPFAIEGELDDATILSLVAFIRSNPAIPGVPEGQAPSQVDGKWPISFISRAGETFIVGLSTSEATGQEITIERRSGGWVLTKFRWWIV